MYELITDKTLAEYEAFLQSHPKGHFAQSSLWAKQKPMWTWDAVAVRGEDGKIKGSLALMTRRVPGIGRTLMYGCRGPVCDLDDRETFAQLLEGAKALAKKYNVDLEVKSSFERVPGTKVKEAGTVEKMLIRGVTRDNDVARISIVGIEDTPGMAYKIFSALSKKNINVDLILQSIGRQNKKDISFTVSKGHLDEALKVLEDIRNIIKADHIDHREDVSKVSIVGAGMTSNPGVAALMFEALYEAGINIHMISTSEIKVSVLVNEANAEKAVGAVHTKFFGE